MNYGAAGAEAPVNEFGYLDGGPLPIWEAAAAFGLASLLFLPLALLIAWLLQRFGLSRSILVSATLAATGSILAFGAIRFFNLLTFQKMDFAKAAAATFELGDPFFETLLVVMFTISWLGALVLAQRLRRRAQPKRVIETFE